MTVERYTYKTPLALDGVGFDLPAASVPHINKVPFTGVLTRVDEVSTRPPNGSDGHKVYISRAVAEHALPTLIGMGIDVDTGFKDHEKQRKIGVITEAFLDGKDLKIVGHMFGKDFPDEVDYIKKHKGILGFSYEIADVMVKDTSAPIWELESFIFTGGAVLKRSAAAYQHTSIAAAATEIVSLDDLCAVPELVAELAAYVTTMRCALTAYHAGRRHAYARRG